jgi:ElaB/YqjD/DUF883 family membrane-anchored ribosome-binding protein
MGQDPAAIRKEIEETREHMGETVDALGYKADVPARAKESISDKVGALRSKVTGVGSQVSDAAPDADDVKQGTKQAVGVVQENPLGLAVGAAAVGFLAGMLLPHTRIEDERVGPMSDQLKEQARQTGEEALEHGKAIAQETAETAGTKAQEAAAEIKDRAQASTQAHAHELSESAAQSTEQLKDGASRQPAA